MKNNFRVGNTELGKGAPVYIIAEAGVNHNGSLDEAFKLIDVAVESGANAVKFQNFKADSLILKEVARAPYQKVNTASNASQYLMLKELELSLEQNRKLQAYCNRKSIEFISTPFDEIGLKELLELKVNVLKISSTDTTNPLLLKKACESQLPIFLSTGMSSKAEVTMAYELIKDIGNPLCILQCSTDYPLSDRDVNLRVIKDFQRSFDCLIGFSDHSIGAEASIAAIALGARVIEKHFTRDKKASGPDHAASLSPDELKDFVRSLRRVEDMMGSGNKTPSLREHRNRIAMQKCVVARTSIKAGEAMTEENLTTKRTGGAGIPASFIADLYGVKTERAYEEEEIINIE